MKEIQQHPSIEVGMRSTDLPFVVRSCWREFPDRNSAWDSLLLEKTFEGYVGPDGNTELRPSR